MRLSDCHGRDNNLNLLRVLAALAVIWAHAFGMTGRAEEEPFEAYFRVGIGDLGVDVFFFLSGLLIAKSFCGRPLLEFAWARVMRIFPALWASSVFLVLVVGIAFSPLGPFEFWSQGSTWDYVVRNSLMFPGIGAQQHLPDAFDSVKTMFNLPLWTLPHELQMYALLAVVGLAGGLRTPWVALGLVLAGLAGVASAKLLGVDLIGLARSRFIVFFFCGALCYVARDRIELNGWVALGLMVAAAIVPLLTDASPVKQAALLVTIPYIALWAAHVPTGWIRKWNVLGDYSYGLYIYAFPVQVALVLVYGVREPLLNFAWTLAVTVPFAVLSWHALERRALKTPLPVWRVPVIAK
jgi:peptidoglycan/LPS O-acetylase OafA/YrhL